MKHLHSDKSRKPWRNGASLVVVAIAAMMFVAGCATGPSYGGQSTTGTRGYGTQVSNRQGSQGCAMCGVVQSVRVVDVGKSKKASVLGTVIGAVAGGLLGHQVGGGKGKKAATVAGAVAGGAVGHHVGEKRAGEKTGYQVVVKLDDGRTATVTQRENPRVQRGDRVQVRDNHVYER